MKKIAITQRIIEHTEYPEIRDALDIRWAEMCKALGYLPIILPSHYNFRQYFDAVPICGVILTGGNDIWCFSNKETSRRRDNFENDILEFAVGRDIPLIGVCRGMQIIADYFGCRLEKIQGHVGVRHPIEITRMTRFRDMLEGISCVNSYHNYQVKAASEDIIVSARSSDGTIEAIEHRKYRIFGQMWHSEREKPFSEYELRIFKKLFQ